MILTCPECATRYFVPDESVGPAGRTVRCASCGNAWRAEAETPLDLTPEAAEEDAAPAEAEASPAKDPARVFREKITAKREAKKAVTAGAVWATAGLVLIGLLTLLILGRNTVARVWPASASAYTAAGLKVNIVGLEIEDQVVEQGFAEGRPALLVRGTLVNVTKRPIRSPPVRLDLLDAEENILAVKIASPPDAEIPAGERRFFALQVEDPPAGVDFVDVTFELGDAAAAAGLRERAPAAPGEDGVRGAKPDAEHAPGDAADH